MLPRLQPRVAALLGELCKKAGDLDPAERGDVE